MSAKDLQRQNDSIVLLFNAKAIGLGLKKVAFDLMKKEANQIECHWYHGRNETDLFFWKDANKNIIKQQLTYLGQMVEWNILEGLRTGVIIDDETAENSGQSAMIRFDTELNRHTVEQGIEILIHVQDLGHEDKDEVISNFLKSPVYRKMTKDEIVARFGGYGRSIKDSSFKKLVEIVLGVLNFKK